MCTTVFQEKESIWFVGGRGDNSNADSDLGGCTKDWWDAECPNKTQAEYAAALAKIMNTNGGPIIALASKAYTSADDRITAGGAAFDNAETGMVVYVIENGTPDVNVSTGRYEITDIDPGGDWIECAGINGADCNVDINIGGAFDTLDTAVDETSAIAHSVTIYTRKNETLSAPVSLSTGGNQLKNIFKRIIGYNTIPGDMNRGEAYYESPYEILQNGSIDSTKCVTLDADGNAFDVLDVGSGVDNLIFENLHLTNTTNYGIDFVAGTSANFVLRNCRFSGGMAGAMNQDVSHVLFDSCYSHDDLTWSPYVFKGPNGIVLNCVSKIGAGNIAAWMTGGTGAAIGNISVGGNFGYRVTTAGSGSGVCIINNTLYNTLTRGVQMDGGDSAVVFNNIFCLAPGATGIYSRNGGSVAYNDYNCFIESDGTPLTVTGTEYSGGEAPVMGAHSVQVDPDFADAANGDFRVRNPLVLRGGRPGPEGNATQMGTVVQEYQFAHRARVVNAGRAGIVR